MFSLGMSIDKKHQALMKAWARVFNAIQIITLHVIMWQLTQQNYKSINNKSINPTIPNQEIR